MQTSERPALLTVKEASALLRCSEQSVYRKIQNGTLPAVRLTGRVGPLRVVRSELGAWLDSRRTST
jgi:excisionase family DNA binding protein